MGMSIAEARSSIFVGVPGSHTGGTDAGSLLRVDKGSTPSIVGEYFSPAYTSARLGTIVKGSKDWVACVMPAAQQAGTGIGKIRMYRMHRNRIHPICEIYAHAIDPPLGQAIAINHQYVITSGIYAEDEYPQSGHVWIFELNDLESPITITLQPCSSRFWSLKL